ncbi:hypothetical protein M406DRAFT_326805 [Cryphonectria parasitica EP155]|uniref:Uncharacterized protein n=1 Tax=Cryphonectria parasitica (strain ATCC 38755 / EP155) TaxID=660469 RepID=A0A9P4Y763_CRYP1|nr:uncharacterized protein M406DRAFT_326805 [Cryphonectria parasitica EP155]KAF3768204.1 hypothetical protein M406DRAFT_326805 [Cryphonectria parasitica EP155]
MASPPQAQPAEDVPAPKRREIPCRGCLLDQLENMLDQSKSFVCADQPKPKPKRGKKSLATACTRCARKKTGCIPVDATTPYLEEWLRAEGEGDSADESDCFTKGLRLLRYLRQQSDHTRRLYQAVLESISMDSMELKSTVDMLEARFEAQIAPLATYKQELSSKHPLSPEYTGKEGKDLSDELRKTKDFAQMLAKVQEQCNEAKRDVGRKKRLLEDFLYTSPSFR